MPREMEPSWLLDPMASDRLLDAVCFFTEVSPGFVRQSCPYDCGVRYLHCSWSGSLFPSTRPLVGLDIVRDAGQATPSTPATIPQRPWSEGQHLLNIHRLR